MRPRGEGRLERRAVGPVRQERADDRRGQKDAGRDEQDVRDEGRVPDRARIARQARVERVLLALRHERMDARACARPRAADGERDARPEHRGRQRLARDRDVLLDPLLDRLFDVLFDRLLRTLERDRHLRGLPGGDLDLTARGEVPRGSDLDRVLTARYQHIARRFADDAILQPHLGALSFGQRGAQRDADRPEQVAQGPQLRLDRPAVLGVRGCHREIPLVVADREVVPEELFLALGHVEQRVRSCDQRVAALELGQGTAAIAGAGEREALEEALASLRLEGSLRSARLLGGGARLRAARTAHRLLSACGAGRGERSAEQRHGEHQPRPRTVEG